MAWRRSYATPPPPMPPGHRYDVRRTTPATPGWRPTWCPRPSAWPTWWSACCPTGTTPSPPTCSTGRTVLVAAHGNSLRALIKHLDGISDADIAELEIPTGVPIVYELDGPAAVTASGSSATRPPSPPPPRRSAARATDRRGGRAPAAASAVICRRTRAAPARRPLADTGRTGAGRLRRADRIDWLHDVVRPGRGALTPEGRRPAGRRRLRPGDLAPGSDLDLLLVHDGKGRIKAIADALWYPIWDAGMPLDHSVRTPKEVRVAMDADIKVALGLLDARQIAGDPDAGRQGPGPGLGAVADPPGQWLPLLRRVTRAAPRPLRGPGVPAGAGPERGAGRPAGPAPVALLRPGGPILAGLLDDPDLDAGGDLLHVAASSSNGRPAGRPTVAAAGPGRGGRRPGLPDADP